jgi:hypothetical protein
MLLEVYHCKQITFLIIQFFLVVIGLEVNMDTTKYIFISCP